MDFHAMNRRQLQALCKKHGVPANLKNAEMADRLASIYKENGESVSQGQSPSSNSDVIAGDDDIKKQDKKVTFSPEDQVIFYEVSVRRRAGRRKPMAASLSKNPEQKEDRMAKEDEQVRNGPKRTRNTRMEYHSRGSNEVEKVEVVFRSRRSRTRSRKEGSAVQGEAKIAGVAEGSEGVLQLDEPSEVLGRNVVKRKSSAPQTGRDESNAVNGDGVGVGKALRRSKRKAQGDNDSKIVGVAEGGERVLQLDEPSKVLGRNVVRRKSSAPQTGRAQSDAVKGDVAGVGKALMRSKCKARGDNDSGTKFASVDSAIQSETRVAEAEEESEGDILLEEPLLSRQASRRKSVVPKKGKVRSDGVLVEKETRKRVRNSDLDAIEENHNETDIDKRTSVSQGPLRRSRRRKTVAPADTELAIQGGETHPEKNVNVAKEFPGRSGQNTSKHNSVGSSNKDEIAAVEKDGSLKRREESILEGETKMTESGPATEKPSRRTSTSSSSTSVTLAPPSPMSTAVQKKQEIRWRTATIDEEAASLNGVLAPKELPAGEESLAEPEGAADAKQLDLDTSQWTVECFDGSSKSRKEQRQQASTSVKLGSLSTEQEIWQPSHKSSLHGKECSLVRCDEDKLACGDNVDIEDNYQSRHSLNRKCALADANLVESKLVEIEINDSNVDSSDVILQADGLSSADQAYHSDEPLVAPEKGLLIVENSNCKNDDADAEEQETIQENLMELHDSNMTAVEVVQGVTIKHHIDKFDEGGNSEIDSETYLTKEEEISSANSSGGEGIMLEGSEIAERIVVAIEKHETAEKSHLVTKENILEKSTKAQWSKNGESVANLSITSPENKGPVWIAEITVNNPGNVMCCEVVKEEVKPRNIQSADEPVFDEDSQQAKDDKLIPVQGDPLELESQVENTMNRGENGFNNLVCGGCSPEKKEESQPRNINCGHESGVTCEYTSMMVDCEERLIQNKIKYYQSYQSFNGRGTLDDTNLVETSVEFEGSNENLFSSAVAMPANDFSSINQEFTSDGLSHLLDLGNVFEIDEPTLGENKDLKSDTVSRTPVQEDTKSMNLEDANMTSAKIVQEVITGDQLNESSECNISNGNSEVALKKADEVSSSKPETSAEMLTKIQWSTVDHNTVATSFMFEQESLVSGTICSVENVVSIAGHGIFDVQRNKDEVKTVENEFKEALSNTNRQLTKEKENKEGSLNKLPKEMPKKCMDNLSEREGISSVSAEERNANGVENDYNAGVSSQFSGFSNKFSFNDHQPDSKDIRENFEAICTNNWDVRTLPCDIPAVSFPRPVLEELESTIDGAQGSENEVEIEDSIVISCIALPLEEPAMLTSEFVSKKLEEHEQLVGERSGGDGNVKQPFSEDHTATREGSKIEEENRTPYQVTDVPSDVGRNEMSSEAMGHELTYGDKLNEHDEVATVRRVGSRNSAEDLNDFDAYTVEKSNTDLQEAAMENFDEDKNSLHKAIFMDDIDRVFSDQPQCFNEGKNGGPESKETQGSDSPDYKFDTTAEVSKDDQSSENLALVSSLEPEIVVANPNEHKESENPDESQIFTSWQMNLFCEDDLDGDSSEDYTATRESSKIEEENGTHYQVTDVPSDVGRNEMSSEGIGNELTNGDTLNEHDEVATVKRVGSRSSAESLNDFDAYTMEKSNTDLQEAAMENFEDDKYSLHKAIFMDNIDRVFSDQPQCFNEGKNGGPESKETHGLDLPDYKFDSSAEVFKDDRSCENLALVSSLEPKIFVANRNEHKERENPDESQIFTSWEMNLFCEDDLDGDSSEFTCSEIGTPKTKLIGKSSEKVEDKVIEEEEDAVQVLEEEFGGNRPEIAADITELKCTYPVVSYESNSKDGEGHENYKDDVLEMAHAHFSSDRMIAKYDTSPHFTSSLDNPILGLDSRDLKEDYLVEADVRDVKFAVQGDNVEDTEEAMNFIKDAVGLNVPVTDHSQPFLNSDVGKDNVSEENFMQPQNLSPEHTNAVKEEGSNRFLMKQMNSSVMERKSKTSMIPRLQKKLTMDAMKENMLSPMWKQVGNKTAPKPSSKRRALEDVRKH